MIHIFGCLLICLKYLPRMIPISSQIYSHLPSGMHANEPEVVGSSRKQSEVVGSSRNPLEPMPPRCDLTRHFEHQFKVFFASTCKSRKLKTFDHKNFKKK